MIHEALHTSAPITYLPRPPQLFEVYQVASYRLAGFVKHVSIAKPKRKRFEIYASVRVVRRVSHMASEYVSEARTSHAHLVAANHMTQVIPGAPLES